MGNTIEWTPDMSVGVSGLDDDHKILVQCLNDFIVAVDNDEGLLVIVPIFISLMDYCSYHFTREEGVMAACNYPDLEAHKKEHVALIKSLNEYRDRYMLSVSEALSNEFREFLETWLRSHIMKVDHAYRDAITGREADYAEELSR